MLFKIEEMTEEKAHRMEQDLTERLQALRENQKVYEIFNGDSGGYKEKIEQTKKDLDKLNSEYAEYLI